MFKKDTFTLLVRFRVMEIFKINIKMLVNGNTGCL